MREVNDTWEVIGYYKFFKDVDTYHVLMRDLSKLETR